MLRAVVVLRLRDGRLVGLGRRLLDGIVMLGRGKRRRGLDRGVLLDAAQGLPRKTLLTTVIMIEFQFRIS